ncbi:MAG: short-chain fatty acid transporter [Bacteroidia bacterium]
MLCATFFTRVDGQGFIEHLAFIGESWYNGVWSLLAFTMQMVMILVLGHMIALSPFVNKLIFWLIERFNNINTATVAVVVATLLVGFLNWGLGLIFGAVIARKLGEFAAERNLKINYPLVGAAGYSGLMIWHGGLSGSAPLTVAASGHFLEDKIGVISTSETIFSTSNLIINAVLILALAVFVYLLAKKGRQAEKPAHWRLGESTLKAEKEKLKPNFIIVFFGVLMLLISIVLFFDSWHDTKDPFAVLNLNYINFFLFGLTFILLGNIKKVEAAVGDASISAAGILIQFPLYAGIMGVMKSTGMIGDMADFFISISNENTYPIYTLISSGIVNLMVPSGGGQWAVQGPIVIEAAQSLNISVSKCIMALAYGDELTNMVQPFWALPLLGITKLKASELLPNTLKFMAVGFVVYALGLLVF